MNARRYLAREQTLGDTVYEVWRVILVRARPGLDGGQHQAIGLTDSPQSPDATTVVEPHKCVGNLVA